jgi:sugar phosphate isomerase/epimerase
MAATLGYDGIEVMIWTDPVSQDAAALAGLAKHYGVPTRPYGCAARPSWPARSRRPR